MSATSNDTVIAAQRQLQLAAKAIEGMAEEIWRDVPGFEGWYWVSSFGRIHKRGIGEMKGYTRRDGYRLVSMTKEICGSKQFYIHRIVAAAFIPNPDNGPCVNHKDCNPSNNSADNLEWVTPGQNIKHSKSRGRFPAFTCSLPGINNPRAKLSESNVREIRKSIGRNSEIGKKFGVSGAAVHLIKTGKNWKSLV